MDPLSIAISALTCAHTVTKIASKGTKTIRALLHASSVVREILEDVANFKTLVSSIQDALQNTADSTFFSLDDQARLSTLLGKAKEKLLEVEIVLEYEMISERTDDGKIFVSRISTVQREKEVLQLRNDFRDLTNTIGKIWLTIIISAQVRMQTAAYATQNALGSIATGVQLLVEAQQKNITPTIQVDGTAAVQHLERNNRVQSGISRQIEDETRCQAVGVQDHTATRTQCPDWAPVAYGARYSDSPSDSSRGNLPRSIYRGTCQAWCSCRCHRRFRSHLMTGDTSPLGFLFMCLSGGKYSLQACDEPRCLRKQNLTMKMAYVFPPWLLAQAICLMFTISCLGKPKFTPRWSATFSGDAKIFTFAIDGDLEGLRKLFEEKAASPHDVAVSTGRTALHYAIVYNHKDVCRFLLDQGADSQVVDNHKDTAINIAWTRVFGKLVDSSTADAFSCMFNDEEYFDSRQFPPLHKIVLGLNGADLACQLELTASRINDRDADGRTALSWAAARGDEQAVSLLLQAKANPNIAGHDGRMPLHWAANSSNSRIIEILLKYKANTDPRDLWNRTPIHYAACNHAAPNMDDARYVGTLVAHGADINAQDCHERTALGYAAKHNHFKSLECLLENVADASLADNWGFSPLFEAVKVSHHESLRLLVLYGAKCKGETIQKQNLLHLVAKQGSMETVDILGAQNLRDLEWEMRDVKGDNARDLLQKRSVKPDGLLEFFDSLSERIRSVQVGAHS